jgi:hypothetical protein
MDILINQAFSNTTFTIFIAILLTPLTGQLAQPMPEILIELIHRNLLIKYFILVLAACRMFYPVTNTKIIVILISAFIVLYLFEILKKYDYLLINKI